MNVLTVCLWLGSQLLACENTTEPVSFGPHVPGQGWMNMSYNGGVQRCTHANFHSTNKIDCFLYVGLFRDGFE